MGHHHHHHSQPSETTPLFYDHHHHHHHHQSEKVTCKQTLIFFLIVLVVVVVWYWLPTATSLKSFSFSHLHITDRQISADWEIGLVLNNRAKDTANYTDIQYTVVYCGDPASQAIVDAHREYGDLVLPPKKQTTVYLRDSVENLVLNRMALSYMTMDVVKDGIVDFDLVVKVTVVAGKDEKRYMMSCEGIEVTVRPYSSWTWNKQGTLDGSGYARYITSDCCHTAEIN